MGAETKWPPISDDIFKYIFVDENVWISIKLSNEQYFSVGPDNGLSPGRCQAIMWTKAGILFNDS